MSDLNMISNINNLLINNQKTTVNEIIELNKITEKYGLNLTKEQAIDLVNNRNTVLKEVGRIELGGGIIQKLIYDFCDSPYLYKDEYLDILEELTNIFYEYREEFDGKLTDDQIIKTEIDDNNYIESLLYILLKYQIISKEEYEKILFKFISLLSISIKRYTGELSSSVKIEIAKNINNSNLWVIGLYLKTKELKESIVILKNEDIVELYNYGKKILDDYISKTKFFYYMIKNNFIRMVIIIILFSYHFLGDHNE